MNAAIVRRRADAHGAVCTECDAFFNVMTVPYWHWSKSKWMHEQGTGHRVAYYRLTPRPV